MEEFTSATMPGRTEGALVADDSDAAVRF